MPVIHPAAQLSILPEPVLSLLVEPGLLLQLDNAGFSLQAEPLISFNLAPFEWDFVVAESFRFIDENGNPLQMENNNYLTW